MWLKYATEEKASAHWTISWLCTSELATGWWYYSQAWAGSNPVTTRMCTVCMHVWYEIAPHGAFNSTELSRRDLDLNPVCSCTCMIVYLIFHHPSIDLLMTCILSPALKPTSSSFSAEKLSIASYTIHKTQNSVLHYTICIKKRKKKCKSCKLSLNM